MASGIVVASDAINEEEKFEKQLEVVELSEGYQQLVKSQIRDAYIMYDKGEISYDEFVAITKEVKNRSEIEMYAKNTLEYSNLVEEYEENYKKLKNRCALGMFGSLGAACAGALGVMADNLLTKKLTQLRSQIDAEKKREETDEDEPVM